VPPFHWHNGLPNHPIFHCLARTGNYNPDWGSIRYDETGRVILQLIRETKGTQDKTRLQFPQERRKIECAQRYFKTLQMDYRHITDNTQAWWLQDDAQQQLLEM
jgi:restriction endonuclease